MSTYVSAYNTASSKYMGPYAIVSHEGPKDFDGKMNGEGTILFANGNTYIGGLKDDMLHGLGRLEDKCNNSVYEGQFENDKRHGFAKFVYEDGEYIGHYMDNKRHGKGKETDAIGNVFDGDYIDGNAAYGKMSYANGDVYIGHFNKDDNRHGFGKFISMETGDLIEGEWIDDEYQDTVDEEASDL